MNPRGQPPGPRPNRIGAWLATVLAAAAVGGCASGAGAGTRGGSGPTASGGTGAATGSSGAAATTAGDTGTDGGTTGGGTTAGGSGASTGTGTDTGTGGGDPICGPRPVPRRGVGARWAFEDAYDNVAGGDWYRDANNEQASLAWGESYVMMSLVAMFRATGSPEYLARLAWHADGVLAQRDDNRGVTDYRGVSAACWRNLSYQPNDEPYCYVVHSGMIAYPMVEFARLVHEAGLEDEVAYDGETFGEKADAYVAAAEQTVAAHDDQYDPAGYYFFRPDATFLAYAGSDVPLNQSNAMGRLLLALYAVTGKGEYLDRASALASRLRAQMTTGPSGEYLWNYWGGTYASPGEDVSHAAINVDFAVLAAAQGVVFGPADLEALAQTFVENVYVDDRTMADNVGGGSTNGSSYRPQVARWLGLAPVRTSIYAAVRDLYELDYPPASIGSGSLLYGWALLAEHEPIHREHFFYYVDWLDPDPNGDGDFREATAYGANVLTVPRQLDEPALVPLEVDVPRPTDVQQWDGAAYHTVVRWQPTGGPLRRFVPYEPRWPFEYWNQGVLYQFADAFVAGDGIRVREPVGVELPSIDTTPPATGQVGQPWTYAAGGAGQAPDWWALSAAPTGARIDPASGLVEWTPPAAGSYCFTVVHQNDWGDAEQSFVVTVP